MTIKHQLVTQLTEVLEQLGISDSTPSVDYPTDPKHGDYATNVALIAAKKLGKNLPAGRQGPRAVAEEIANSAGWQMAYGKWLDKIEIAGPGFINFWIKDAYLLQYGETQDLASLQTALSGKKLMVEYAHPNTHKEMHIGHMRTLVIGEALSRLFDAVGAEVFRANYQGDIGMHVAKALFGIPVLLAEKSLQLADVSTWNNFDKAHFLGQAYALGSQEYEEHKEEIDQINKDLYAQKEPAYALYRTTRAWSLDYYDEFYKRFYTKFDRLFFESETADLGKKTVEEYLGDIFETQNGAIIFPGEKYGLHTRVFITTAGNPTYEGKDMGLGFIEHEAFPFDQCIHIVASEQTGYFQVVIKVLQLIDPKKFAGEYHLPMGMVQLKDRKMSSRTGDVLTVDWLLDQIKERVEQITSEGRISSDDKDKTIEQIVIGAVKYSVLKVSTTQDAAFDIETSVSLDGNSGPYLQYTYARTRSVLSKAENAKLKTQKLAEGFVLELEERELLRLLARFPEVVEEAAVRYAPNVLCTYLFAIAQAFNLFYQKCPILKAEEEVKDFRLALTDATGTILKNGLNLLGIQAPEKM